MKIFINYAREDEAIARRLHVSLSGMPGVLPWLDTSSLLPGDDWQECINEAMEDSRLIIVLFSSRSVNKDGFVQKEVRTALDLSEEKPPGQCFIIPVRVEFCEPRFRQIRKLQWVDLFDGWGEGITKIHSVIKREQARDRELLNIVDAAQQEKNREDAKLIIAKLTTGLHENLGNYAEWLWRHDYGLHPYEKARSSIPNWTKQAQPEWLRQLHDEGALDSVDPETGLFTNVGLEVLDLL